MKLFLFLIVLVIGVFAEKEILDRNTQDSTSKLTKKLWFEVYKRLRDYGYSNSDIGSLDNDLDEPQCTYDLKNGTIIRTHDSIEAGATFINSQIGDSREDCMEQCCEIGNCNLAVFKEEKGEHSCYLFDCGTPNICKFTTHPGYTVIQLPVRTTTNKVLEKHEDDLENLAEPETTTTSTTTAATTTTPAPIAKQPVSLFGKCEQHQDCAGTWSQCLGGYCVCKDGYHEQDGTCRKDCTKFEFECRNTGQPLVYPQCVGIYNKCDGIVLCKDGSDEMDCTVDTGRNPSIARPMNDNQKSEVDTSSKEQQDSKSSVQESEPVRQPKLPPVVGGREQSKPFDISGSASQENKEDDKPPQNADSSSSSDKSAKQQTDSASDKSKSDSSQVQDQTNIDKTEQKTDEKSSDADNGNEESSENVKVVNEDKDTDGENSPQSAALGVEVLSEEVNAATAEEDDGVLVDFYRSNKGAVVALSLGLCITAMLLIFVGCRLRNVKKRLRRGRPLNSNEADYLINGMYL